MSAPLSRRDLAAFLPHSVSTPAVSAPRRHTGPSVARRIRDAVATLRGLAGRHAVLNELQSLSGRELADIGLSRSDIHRVFDPSFAEEYRSRG